MQQTTPRQYQSEKFIPLPSDIWKTLMGVWRDETVAKQEVAQAVVLELLREGKITSGKAAGLLGMSRWDFMELMSKEDIPMANFDSDELKEQMRDFKKLRE